MFAQAGAEECFQPNKGMLRIILKKANSTVDIVSLIRGFLANGNRAEAIAKARELLKVPAAAPPPQDTPPAEEPFQLERPCPCCGGRMRVVEIFARGGSPSPKYHPSYRARPAPLVIRLDTS